MSEQAPDAEERKIATLLMMQEEHEHLEKSYSRLSQAKMLEPGVVGEWSIKDLLAHLMDWEQRFITWYQMGVRGENPELPETGLTWSELDHLNQQIYEKYRSRPLEEIQVAFEDSFMKILEVARSIPADDYFKPGLYPWLQNETLFDYLVANSVEHYRWAEEMIRDWQKNQKTAPK